ncbi:S-formylglutathione hydrolase [Parvularcula maris]|uniref:S-formylglutathione hydrolase n=1 Tax=Parvularcula maris TaxID=2965077 RepID=A0A9X2LDC0_9PROT|nr:S-formylglutathione hydrolase [Parvularcula maris]MCQ8186442.1 S-formylglutathione hydrolase [Parvularcula maris]
MADLVSETRCFGGSQRTYEHRSDSCGCAMRLAAYVPDLLESATAPVLVYLSGLTCTEENATTKAGFQRVAAELGLIVVAPDTSPRGDHVPDAEDEYDFGKGAGFYLDATEEPWCENYRMKSYVTGELLRLIEGELPADMARVGITGHSMGGHGALTLHLKNPELFKTVSAFAPIVAPTEVPWGQKALSRYLGEDPSRWAAYDASRLVREAPSAAEILVDQGTADNFLEEQLRPHLFEEACRESGQKLTLRMQEGYDHSYYFVSTFIEDHLRWHAERLTG